MARSSRIEAGDCTGWIACTESLDPELLGGARVLAAQRGTSVSKLLAAELERLVRDEQAYDRAREQALNHLDQGLHLGGGHPDRDSLHER